MGIPVERAQQDRRGLAPRRRPHPRRRRGPRDQHAGRPRRAHGRLGDPAGRDRAGHPLHHDDDRRLRGGARDRRRARPARRRSRSLQELHGERPQATARRARPRRERLERRPATAPRSDRPGAGAAARAAPFGRRLPRGGERAGRRLPAARGRGPATGPRPLPGQFYMLAAGEGWGGDDGSAPTWRARSRSAGCAATGWSSCSRRSAPAPSGWRASSRATDCGCVGPARDRVHAPAAGAVAARVAGRRRHRHRAARDLGRGAAQAGAERRRCSAFAPAPTRRRPVCSRATEVATDDGSGRAASRPRDRAARAGARRRPTSVVYACGPPRDARGGPADLRRARGAGAARDGGGHGLRLRRLLRLRGADPIGYRRLCVDGPVVARPTSTQVVALTSPRAGRLGAPAIDLRIELAGLELEHPVLNGSGTFDAIAALRTFGDALREQLPVLGLRLEDDHARSRAAATRRRACGRPRPA